MSIQFGQKSETVYRAEVLRWLRKILGCENFADLILTVLLTQILNFGFQALLFCLQATDLSPELPFVFHGHRDEGKLAYTERAFIGFAFRKVHTVIKFELCSGALDVLRSRPVRLMAIAIHAPSTRTNSVMTEK
ncbi:hypothetical protein XI03_34800 [Bradyrhizobium sp. CCBAU 65884]|nr:hypothetical protein [Bradyrhizobium sp. CCBAU 65884]